jgi:hypothetical protein
VDDCRGIRAELRELELFCDAHPVTCDCESCGRILELYSLLAELDPDDDPDDLSGEEEKPYWWNR